MMNFKAPKGSTLEIRSDTLCNSGGPDAVLARIRSGRAVEVTGKDSGSAGEAEDTLLATRTDAEVGRILRGLKRKANDEYLNRGVDVLYMAFGSLVWTDVDGTELKSPLLFVPVKLISTGPKSTPQIESADGDSVLNPALVLQLGRLGVHLRKESDDLENLSVTDVLSLVSENLEGRSALEEWNLEDVIYIGAFTFEKEAMYQDLLDHEEEILEHPIIRALGTSDPLKQSSEFSFDPIDPADIDRVAMPEEIPLILDADSSQRAAISAAVAGQSFVMDGPPGTGKSQTISNMIGSLLHAGKTVLFVSEKIAALDVVKNRLSEAGLGSYILELHSHKTRRKDVATELLTTLDNIARPPASVSQVTRHRAKEHREALNGYARAMNEKRMPLNRSVHHVVGLYSQINGIAGALAPEGTLKGLSERGFEDIQQSLTQLAGAWRPATQGKSYLWRDVIDTRSIEPELVQAEEFIIQLRQSLQIHAELACALSLSKPSDTPKLISFLEHKRKPHAHIIPDSWITRPDMRTIDEARRQLGRQIDSLQEAVAGLEELSNTSRTEFPEFVTFPAAASAVSASPKAIRLDKLDSAALRGAADKYRDQAAILSESLASLQNISGKIEGPEVQGFEQVESFQRLIQLAAVPHPPQSQWLSTTSVQNVRWHVEALKLAINELNEAEGMAAQIYRVDALAAPIAELNDRFTSLHRGLRKLSGSYRADKKAVAALMVDATQVKNGIASLDKALTWSSAHKAYIEASSDSPNILGDYWQGRETDFDAISAALRTADEVLVLNEGAVSMKTGNYLATAGQHSTYRTYSEMTDAAAGTIRAWKDTVLAGGELTPPSELVLGSVADATSWLEAHLGPFQVAAARVHFVASVTGTDHTVREAEDIVTALKLVELAEQQLEESVPRYRDEFGDFVDGVTTDLDNLDHNLTWARQLRSMNLGALTEGQNDALQRSVDDFSAGALYEKWDHALTKVLQAFGQERRGELREELDDFAAAPEYLADLREDTAGQGEWLEFTRAYAVLDSQGLKETVDFCIERKVASEKVADTVNHALLKGWIDEVVDSDNRLRPLGAADHDRCVSEFQNLDHEMTVGATAEIIAAANARRPVTTDYGESAVIRREGGKQRRHMSVQDLLARTSTVTPSIKPIFMMSPMAVSQYLPHDLRFDVVIFDEASQVTPADAINSIYRGNSLILAGDDKQLPPMSFFERNDDPDDEDQETDVSDFQSVLELAKSAGAFKDLRLRWHYRSRHEELIAFSNYKFYEGNLVTFPSAQVDGEDVGIEFIHAGGMYRRGAGRCNPVEAEKVAERVIYHYSTRPDSTLGVVTFSAPQAEAVRMAVENMRKDRPELDRFFDSSDRLGGFFVRPLEQVQGDERDVIIFSIGYGPDEAGKITSNFGALNKEKGWRRLNVGITRAKMRVEVVASMRAEEIPPSKNENIEYFRAYLDYAVKGTSVLAVPVSSTGLEPESPFEEAVIEVIRGWGYTVEPQVGAAGYRIDMAVRHPDYPGMFALGIECDGYQYHSAPAARDRDRLRESVLTGLGWRLHRIWGTAWYRDKKSEVIRLKEAIEHAIAQGTNVIEDTRPASSFPTVELETAPVSSSRDWAKEYRKAERCTLPFWLNPGDEGSHTHMIESIETLAAEEGPVHLDQVDERLRDWWVIGRIGAKIRKNIEQAIGSSVVRRDGKFLLGPAAVTVARTPADGVQRKAEHIHSDEVEIAVSGIVQDARGASREEVIKGVASLFGWTRTGDIVSRVIGDAIDNLIFTEKLTEKEAMLSRV